MIALTTIAAAARRFSFTSTMACNNGSLIIHQENHASVIVLPYDLDNLLEDVKIAIAIRDAK